ncbi:MAG TPA: dihydrodipicolinate synthase family protein [Vicinamibacterales bacterium]|nr:dihydrodipicolinate synthase family protein [Vicinamibacterales bacterium]
MEIPRRTFLGAMGAAAMAAAVPRGLDAAAGSASGDLSKVKFWVAACTPCDRNLAFDGAVYRDMMAWFKEQGADGVLVLGTTGEFPSFSVAERRTIAEVALKHANGLDMIVQTGTPDFPETLELSRHAADHGANGLLIVPPFYYKAPPTEGIARYYSMIFDAVKIPINLYHIPGTSGVPISIQLLRSLAHYPNLAGIKDSNGIPEEYETFADEFPHLNIRTGTVNNLENALDRDMGAMLMEGNLFPGQIARVFAAKRAGRDDRDALAAFRQAVEILRPGGIYGYGPMKYALSLQMGTPQTYQRPPFLDVTDAQKAAIKAGLARLKEMSATTHA